MTNPTEASKLFIIWIQDNLEVTQQWKASFVYDMQENNCFEKSHVIIYGTLQKISNINYSTELMLEPIY